MELSGGNIPDQAKGAHSHGLQIRVPGDMSTWSEATKRRREPSSEWLGRGGGWAGLPRGDLECGAKDLGSYEFGHDVPWSCIDADCAGGIVGESEGKGGRKQAGLSRSRRIAYGVRRRRG